ncbi:MAG: hypothetical protein M2R46_01502 [Verrucomicrobia subdivision 3 bacterium]|nr:hypothetical protein [Limisphaerales bacterium]MCS1413785.1 hypothetical protein [Limisphaerales bacterium]
MIHPALPIPEPLRPRVRGEVIRVNGGATRRRMRANMAGLLTLSAGNSKTRPFLSRIPATGILPAGPRPCRLGRFHLSQ